MRVAVDLLWVLPEEILDNIVDCLTISNIVSLLHTAKYLACTVVRYIAKNYELNTRQTDTVLRFLLGQSFFLTGEGGVGKSFVLHKMIDIAREIYEEDNVAVVASTSSAVNQLITASVPVRTLHSLINAKEEVDANGVKRWVPYPCKKELARLQAIFLDEVSMTTCELYDCLVTCINPQCQIVATGDLLQLPPCGNPGNIPFVFKSPNFRKLCAVELLLNVRASGNDEDAMMFRKVLHRIRFGIASLEDERWLRSHSRPGMMDEFAIFTKRKRCDELNGKCFSMLTTPIHTMYATDEVETIKWTWTNCEDEGGKTVLIKDKQYYNCVSIDDAMNSIGRSSFRDPVRSPFTREEYSALYPPPEVKVEISLRVGMQVVLTRAIWSQKNVTQVDDDDNGVNESDTNEGDDDTSITAHDRERVLIAANGEVGKVVHISRKWVMVVFPSREGGGKPRRVQVDRVKYRQGLAMCRTTLLQRIWVRKQIPLEIGYARTAHKAQGTTLSRPTHLDCTDVWYGSKEQGARPYVSPSIIYVLIGRARSISQLHFARNKFGLVFNVRDAKPDPEALAYHREVVDQYKPLQVVIDALGRDDHPH